MNFDQSAYVSGKTKLTWKGVDFLDQNGKCLARQITDTLRFPDCKRIESENSVLRYHENEGFGIPYHLQSQYGGSRIGTKVFTTCNSINMAEDPTQDMVVAEIVMNSFRNYTLFFRNEKFKIQGRSSWIYTSIGCEITDKIDGSLVGSSKRNSWSAWHREFVIRNDVLGTELGCAIFFALLVF